LLTAVAIEIMANGTGRPPKGSPSETIRLYEQLAITRGAAAGMALDELRPLRDTLQRLLDEPSNRRARSSWRSRARR